MSAVLGWLQLLRSGRLEPAQAQKAMETIENNAQLQNQLINDMLDVSRIVTGNLRFDVERVDVRRVLESTLASVGPAAEEKSIILAAELPPAGVATQGNAARLQQVFTNVIGNAVKFSPPGGRVEVRAAVHGDRLQATISDQGEGIEAAALPYIFDLFRQADGSITRNHGGLGLGLAIARHLLDLHGGTIRGDSAGPGRGATFTIELPIAPSSAGSENGDERPAQAAARGTAAALAGARILVVDDDLASLEMMQHMLALEGAEVHVAADVDEAFARFAGDEHIEVLISDIGMPHRDGYNLIASLRRDFPERAARLVAIAVSGYARSEDRIRALSAGYSLHVAKPFDVAFLIEAIANLRRAAPMPDTERPLEER
jgi:CheY-like chemotaxis protein